MYDGTLGRSVTYIPVHRMPKRKKSSSGSSGTAIVCKCSRSGASDGDNPLSDARRQSHHYVSKTSRANTSKNDLNALNLWHRKSGAGYALFVSYYGSQPLGVVADGTDTSTTRTGTASATRGDTADLRHGTQRGRGMSRAAKRRAKKRKRGTTVGSTGTTGVAAVTATDHTCLYERTSGSSSSEPLPAAAATPVDPSHPLVEAFASQSKQYPHLAPYIHALSRPLPLTFRLRNENACASPANRSRVAKLLAKDYSDLVMPVAYDSSQAIYQSTAASNLSKSNLSKLSPSLKELLVSGSLDGTLARQELGSMLPVLALSALGALIPGAKVLDLCASPGSKTMQALEIAASRNAKSGKRGRVVANDVHTGRLVSLRDAVGRSGLDGAFTSRITYTNFDASLFPSPNSGKLFDAIIADVPCSGDGTIRKDRHILPMWTPSTGNALHGLQVRILVRAIELIKVDGVVCYSTCSLNPVEDEAVVAEALEMINNGDKVRGDTSDDNHFAEIVKWPDVLLPGFQTRKGVENWKVAFYDHDLNEGINMSSNADFGDLQYYQTYEDARNAGIDGIDVEKSLWPDSIQSKRSLHLTRCSRLWPNDQDTGGFFVSLIRKIR